jgi:hypothetical protein
VPAATDMLGAAEKRREPPPSSIDHVDLARLVHSHVELLLIFSAVSGHVAARRRRRDVLCRDGLAAH